MNEILLASFLDISLQEQLTEALIASLDRPLCIMKANCQMDFSWKTVTVYWGLFQ